MTATFLGIDIGTSGVKAILINAAGKVLGDATAPAKEPVRPHPGWSEQDPADWWSATLAAVDKLSKSRPDEMASVTGIGAFRPHAWRHPSRQERQGAAPSDPLE